MKTVANMRGHESLQNRPITPLTRATNAYVEDFQSYPFEGFEGDYFTFRHCKTIQLLHSTALNIWAKPISKHSAKILEADIFKLPNCSRFHRCFKQGVLYPIFSKLPIDFRDV